MFFSGLLNLSWWGDVIALLVMTLSLLLRSPFFYTAIRHIAPLIWRQLPVIFSDYGYG